MRSFNQQFENYKLSVSGLTSLGEEAFLHWEKNYVNQRKEFNPTEFLTGKIYSFEYNDRLEKGKSFVNKRPVIFFTGYFNYENKAAFGGIDLILMPPMMRIPFFNRIMGVYESQIESNMRKIESGDTKSQSQLKTDYETLNAILNNIPFKNSYRAWDLKKVRDVIEIPYTDWTRIVYLHTRSIEGTQIEEIYKKNLIS